MSETWFVTGSWAGLIVPVQVEKCTEHCVWIKGRRTTRTGRRSYFKSWQEAKAALLAEAEARVNSARRQLEQANGHLGNIKGLKDPGSPTQ